MSDLRAFIRFFLYLFVPLTVGYFTYRFLQNAFFEPFDTRNKRPIYVMIDESDFKSIAKLLQSRGIVRYSKSLELLARLKGINTEIKQGEYQLSPSMTPEQVLKRLSSGQVYLRPLRVEAGDTIWEIGERLDQAELLKAEEFTSAATNPQLLVRAGIGSSSFEGYLAPDQYEFGRPIEAREVLWAMLEKAEKDWTEEFSTQLEALGLSRHEILTLASLIQVDSPNPLYNGKYSSVLHNRLAQGMKLQSEGSVRYGMSESPAELTEEDLQNPHPFNTYVNFGLPPGPVCNPGEDALRAALFPEATSLLFALKDNQGGMLFASTREDYNRELRRLIGAEGEEEAAPQ